MHKYSGYNKVGDHLEINEKDFNRKRKVLISNEIFAYENVEAVGDIIVDNIIYNKELEDNPIEIINNLNMKEFLELIKKIDIKNTSLEMNDIIPFVLLKYGLNPKRIFSYICRRINL